MRTPKASDGVGGALGERVALERGNSVGIRDQVMDLVASQGKPVSRSDMNLLPTTRVSMANGASQREIDEGNPKVRIEAEVMLGAERWGRFASAIQHWENLTRPAPEPTKPDGKNGTHRLSSEFTEWMMGLPAGWITGNGVGRNEELKMAGNGVVPQQAELALRILLEME
jgi:DNA (cytosine-5)-methyltransferase 1